MRSHLLDREAAPARSDVRELLVVWQHPVSRTLVPIGRLSHDDGFHFSYTRAASRVEDFRPLPGLGDLRVRYSSQALPAIFRQRVMESDRPDFAQYVASLGLAPETATPWEQIVRSGGSRAGDTLQFMEIPRVTAGRARARFLANGVRHIPNQTRLIGGQAVRVTAEEHEDALRALAPGTTVDLVAEDGNEHDRCATLVTRAGVPIGYVPQLLSASVRRLLASRETQAQVVRVNGPAAPAHLRLVLDLDTPVDQEFQFDVEGDWDPLSTEAD